MTRNHIHFSNGLPNDVKAVVSGMRNDAEVLIYVDIEKSLGDGMLWWLSENGVVLTEGNEDGFLPTKYFQRVEGRMGDVGLLWQDGVQIAELPQKYRDRKPPSGKNFKERGPSNARGRGGGRGDRRRGGDRMEGASFEEPAP